uniref:Protein SLX4IP-like n=1 Tax=Petromyzon marinus TaxID=7757 RepID=A0AAJ7T1E5_PETMA|nr:protein SLX4IP-like [Petromyzon marinus]
MRNRRDGTTAEATVRAVTSSTTTAALTSAVQATASPSIGFMEPDRDTLPLKCGSYVVLAEVRPVTRWTTRWSGLPRPYKQEVLSLLSDVVEQRVNSYLQLRRQRKPMQSKQMKERAHSKPVTNAGKYVEVETYFRKRHVGLRCLSGRFSERSYVKMPIFPEQLIVCVNAVCEAPPPPPPPPPPHPPAVLTPVAPLLRPEGVGARCGDRALSEYFNCPAVCQADAKALLTASAQRRQAKLKHIVKKIGHRKGKDRKPPSHRTGTAMGAEPAQYTSSDSPRISLQRARRHEEMKENNERSGRQWEGSVRTEARVDGGGDAPRAIKVEERATEVTLRGREASARHAEAPASVAAAAVAPPPGTSRGRTKLSRRRQQPPTLEVDAAKTRTDE